VLIVMGEIEDDGFEMSREDSSISCRKDAVR
jgi:hypothetical protein